MNLPSCACGRSGGDLPALRSLRPSSAADNMGQPASRFLSRHSELRQYIAISTVKINPTIV